MMKIFQLGNKIKSGLFYLGVVLLVILELAVLFAAVTVALPAWVAVLFSNLLTIIIVRLLFVMLDSRAKTKASGPSIEQRQAEELKRLNLENSELKRQYDILSQTKTFFNQINFRRRLCLMDKTTLGYVVREEAFKELKKDGKLNELIPVMPTGLTDLDGLKGRFTKNEPRSLLNINKVKSKFTIGIDLDDISYAVHQGKYLLKGVEIKVLYNTSADLVEEGDDAIDICWITSKSGGKDSKRTLRESHDYDQLKKEYRKRLESEMNSTLRNEAAALCGQLTSALQQNLMLRYPNVRFITEEEAAQLAGLQWLEPGESSDMHVASIMSDMYMGLDLVTKSHTPKAINSPQDS